MRLAAQSRGGFYAAAPEAVAAVLERIYKPRDGPCLVLDPCAGLAAALVQIRKALGATAYAVELDEGRAETVTEAIGEATTLAPADFMRTRISARSFSMAWVNPPFDYQSGGQGRVEHGFLDHVGPMLVDGGLMCLICPEAVAKKYNFLTWFCNYFEDCSAMRFPEDHRPYNEVVVMGKRKKQPKYGYEAWQNLLDRTYTYDLPAGRAPRMFVKSEPTDTEVMSLLKTSTLRHQFATPPELVPPRPPIPPKDGHVAMVLSDGLIDGAVYPEGEHPHVIRGCMAKEEYLSDRTDEENEDGSITTKSVYSEKMTLKIRVLDHLGQIVTLT